MSDVIGDLLGKLNKKTGREWNISDLVRLAKKLPDLNEGNVDNLFSELGEMGLELPDETKQKVKNKLAENKEGSTEEKAIMLKENAVKGVKRTKKKPGISRSAVKRQAKSKRRKRP